jgi:hypothetical protein
VVFAGLPLAATLVVPILDLDAALLFQDPVARGGLPLSAGLFSNLGIIAWWIGAVACLLAALVLPQGRPRLVLLCGGLLTALLATDDMFMLHEAVLPRIGIPEKLTHASYALLSVLYLLVFHSFHRRMDWPLLLVALGLFACSMVVDIFVGGSRMRVVMAEDGTKFGGIVAWAGYHVLAARYWLRRAIAGGAGAASAL